MICGKCNHDLADCTCEDLSERFESIVNSPYVHIGPEYQQRIRANIERQKQARDNAPQERSE